VHSAGEKRSRICPTFRQVSSMVLGSSFRTRCFELGEELLDGVQVRAVGWQEEHVGSRVPDGAPCRLAFVAAEIVEDHDIAFGKGRSKYLLDVEAFRQTTRQQRTESGSSRSSNVSGMPRG
jgi:hypothetical protein